ncbi:hypothetical protein PghCCS26_23890 [Paenibacillus glycanilyticus]|uniref:Uncharacterized protein n=1 Tax=Paenibacillus glycanilyticus TaxID=126569 RepID=A0ABQ6NJI5_9BACL|nr:hypothetical protein PghCCS26_23890 [Paenibacillus glycanilyticus]
MLSYFFFYNGNIRSINLIVKGVTELLDHPFFFEEQMKHKSWELKQIDKHAWKYAHMKRKNLRLPLFLLLRVLGRIKH